LAEFRLACEPIRQNHFDHVGVSEQPLDAAARPLEPRFVVRADARLVADNCDAFSARSIADREAKGGVKTREILARQDQPCPLPRARRAVAKQDIVFQDFWLWA